jgi:ribose/xylose/arabinose/galactoside ABC-type transport system permease subunit
MNCSVSPTSKCCEHSWGEALLYCMYSRYGRYCCTVGTIRTVSKRVDINVQSIISSLYCTSYLYSSFNVNFIYQRI